MTLNARVNEALLEWDLLLESFASEEEQTMPEEERKEMSTMRVRVRHPKAYWLYRRIVGVIDSLLMNLEHYAFEFHLLALAALTVGMTLEWAKRQRCSDPGQKAWACLVLPEELRSAEEFLSEFVRGKAMEAVISALLRDMYGVKLDE